MGVSGSLIVGSAVTSAGSSVASGAAVSASLIVGSAVTSAGSSVACGELPGAAVQAVKTITNKPIRVIAIRLLSFMFNPLLLTMSQTA
jgi:hypothetical protein